MPVPQLPRSAHAPPSHAPHPRRPSGCHRKARREVTCDAFSWSTVFGTGARVPRWGQPVKCFARAVRTCAHLCTPGFRAELPRAAAAPRSSLRSDVTNSV